MAPKTNVARIATDGHYAGSFDSESEQEVYDETKEHLVRQMLHEIGEDPEREGLRRTPLRVAKAMDFLTSGYQMSAEEIIKKAVFEENVKEMVIVRDIEFYSMCEHHMLPFFGHAHVGYLPNGKVVGLSKIARVVDVFARRLQVQERLTNQVADALMEHLGAHGVAVVIEASHLHDDARRAEAEQHHRLQRHARHLRGRPAHPRRVHGVSAQVAPRRRRRRTAVGPAAAALSIEGIERAATAIIRRERQPLRNPLTRGRR